MSPFMAMAYSVYLRGLHTDKDSWEHWWEHTFKERFNAGRDKRAV